MKQLDGKISVYGSTGFIGSHFTKLSSHSTLSIERSERKPRSANLLYLISTTSNKNLLHDVQIDVDTNIRILLETLNHFKKTGGVFNFVSSWFVYGNSPLPARETNTCHPKGFYSLTKKMAEDIIICYCETFGLSYRIFRLANVYGEGDKFSKQKNALQYLIDEMAENRPITLLESGNFFRDYLHVTDAVRAIDLCLERAPLNSIFNIGTGKKTLFRDVIKFAHAELGSRSKIQHAPALKETQTTPQDFYMDTGKLTALGFTPRIPIYEGVSFLCQSYKKSKVG